MKFEFKIEEQATYVQTGTVTVEAESLEQATELVMKGEYEHSGDNNIDPNTESNCVVLEATYQPE